MSLQSAEWTADNQRICRQIGHVACYCSNRWSLHHAAYAQRSPVRPILAASTLTASHLRTTVTTIRPCRTVVNHIRLVTSPIRCCLFARRLAPHNFTTLHRLLDACFRKTRRCSSQGYSCIDDFPQSPLTTLPPRRNLIDVKVDGVLIATPVDTGAQISVMCSDLRHRVNKVLKPPTLLTVRVVDDGTLPVLGMCSVRLSVADRSTTATSCARAVLP